MSRKVNYLHEPILLFFFIPFFLLLLAACQLPEFGEPPNWKGIQPGRTNTSEVITILGEPDRRFAGEGLVTFLYPDVDISIDTKCDCVFGIMVHLPLTGEEGEIMLLHQVLMLYGEPNRVAEARDTIGTISLVYADKGTIFSIRQLVSGEPLERFIVTSITYYSPAPLALFLKFHGVKGIPQLGRSWENYFEEKEWEPIILREENPSIPLR